MEKLKSKGKCPFCDKVSAKAGISRHLSTHLKKQPINPASQAFHVLVQNGQYFLHLLVDGNASLTKLDKYLRSIWLECCGHLSQFSIGGTWGGREIGKSRKAKDIFRKGLKMNYVYDFGTSTELDIKVMGEYALAVKNGIELLSRNEPLEIYCHLCKTKPAVEVCAVHWYDDGGFMFCEKCVSKHAKTCPDAADYSMMPIVNSPRVGECGYEGGRIDLERDGAFVNP